MLETITIVCDFSSKREGVNCWDDVDMNDVPTFFVKGHEYVKAKYSAWDYDLDNPGWSFDRPFRCLACGFWSDKEYPYCPECSSRMENGEEKIDELRDVQS